MEVGVKLCGWVGAEVFLYYALFCFICVCDGDGSCCTNVFKSIGSVDLRTFLFSVSKTVVGNL